MSADQPIIIKRKKAGGHGHHGGAWKVAYADFVTAMMAFFLLLWLLATSSPEEKDAIQGYFQDPVGFMAGQGGGLNAPGAGMTGDGGANLGAIDLNNPLTQAESEREPMALEPMENTDLDSATDEALQEEYRKREQAQLDELEQELRKQLKSESSPLIKLNDQIVIDQTGIGLRIQLFDKEQRPMFDLGSEQLATYAEEVLLALAPYLETVPNFISVDGHTDSLPFASALDYSNWELSAARANSARRAMEDGGLSDRKVLTVQGFGSAIPRVNDDPTSPENRRIVIMVLKDEYARALGAGSSIGAAEFIEKTEVIEPSELQDEYVPEPVPETEIHLDANGNPVILSPAPVELLPAEVEYDSQSTIETEPELGDNDEIETLLISE